VFRSLNVLVVVSLLTLVGAPCSARERPASLYEVLGKSELVLVGTVAAIESRHYRVTVQEVLTTALKGRKPLGKEVFVVRRARNPQRGPTDPPMAVGQGFLFCLDLAGKGFRSWKRSPLGIAPGGPKVPATVPGLAPVLWAGKGRRAPTLGEVRAAVRGYRQCVRFAGRHRSQALLSATKAQLAAFCKLSPLAGRMIQSTPFATPSPVKSPR
jgi:hypothetical protein